MSGVLESRGGEQEGPKQAWCPWFSSRVRRPPSEAPGSLPEAQLGCILHLERRRVFASPSPLEALE